MTFVQGFFLFPAPFFIGLKFSLSMWEDFFWLSEKNLIGFLVTCFPAHSFACFCFFSIPVPGCSFYSCTLMLNSPKLNLWPLNTLLQTSCLMCLRYILISLIHLSTNSHFPNCLKFSFSWILLTPQNSTCAKSIFFFLKWAYLGSLFLPMFILFFSNTPIWSLINDFDPFLLPFLYNSIIVLLI